MEKAKALDVANERILREALQETFGYGEFRVNQLEMMQQLLRGGDCFCMMATGSGKSLSFQLPAIALRKQGVRATSIVVSPLVSLMEDQVKSLRALGVSSLALGSGASHKEEEQAMKGEYTVLYATPEKVAMWRHGFKELQVHARVVSLAIDESHCVSEWGHNFRPQYRQLGELRDWLPNIPLLTLTATATPLVKRDIITNLRLFEPLCVTASFNRANLKYTCINSKSKNDLLKVLLNLRATAGELTDTSSSFPPTLVYTNTKKEAEELAGHIQECTRFRGVEVRYYSSALTQEERSEVHAAFARDEAQIVVATVAFGMGIHKPNIRFVVHYGMTQSVEAYYQQTGRAGRDGLPAQCVMLAVRSDGRKCYNIGSTDVHTDSGKARLQANIKKMLEYCTRSKCRRKFLLSYFGEVEDEDEVEVEGEGKVEGEGEEPKAGAPQLRTTSAPPFCCDLCDVPASEKVVRARSNYGPDIYLLLKAVQECGEAYDLSMALSILLGSHNAKARRITNYSSLSTFGAGAGKSETYWRELANICTDDEDLLSDDFHNGVSMVYCQYRLTQRGRSFLGGDLLSGMFAGGGTLGAYLTSSSSSSSSTSSSYSSSALRKHEYWLVPSEELVRATTGSAARLDLASMPLPPLDAATITTTTTTAPAAKATTTAAAAAATTTTTTTTTGLDRQQRAQLADQLRAMRDEEARRSGVMSYEILSAADVSMLIDKLPTTLAKLDQIAGWEKGNWKRRVCGEKVIQIIRAAVKGDDDEEDEENEDGEVQDMEMAGGQHHHQQDEDDEEEETMFVAIPAPKPWLAEALETKHKEMAPRAPLVVLTRPLYPLPPPPPIPVLFADAADVQHLDLPHAEKHYVIVPFFRGGGSCFLGSVRFPQAPIQRPFYGDGNYCMMPPVPHVVEQQQQQQQEPVQQQQQQPPQQQQQQFKSKGKKRAFVGSLSIMGKPTLEAKIARTSTFG